ncbi:3-dehydroquinate synthase [Colletotrichum musicola]|uniref:3-dehydroquinate synthase n=1 Tax=Colletotrichum musicola TaxID=2175873 RepID=A0A8H6MI73_9PEZI|nr:3-dehydroquinate synthase [Colletotrichum musicola]
MDVAGVEKTANEDGVSSSSSTAASSSASPVYGLSKGKNLDQDPRTCAAGADAIDTLKLDSEVRVDEVTVTGTA